MSKFSFQSHTKYGSTVVVELYANKRPFNQPADQLTA